MQSYKDELEYRVSMPVTHYILLGNCRYPVCPRCQQSLERDYMAFCDRCGQKLSWKESNLKISPHR